jgi:hypothetical protein
MQMRARKDRVAPRKGHNKSLNGKTPVEERCILPSSGRSGTLTNEPAAQAHGKRVETYPQAYEGPFGER